MAHWLRTCASGSCWSSTESSGARSRSRARRTAALLARASRCRARLVEFDDAARALGEHKACRPRSRSISPGATPSSRSSPGDARPRSCAPPLGQTSGGVLIVAAAIRRPGTARSAARARQRPRSCSAIAPAQRLENLIEQDVRRRRPTTVRCRYSSSSVEVMPPPKKPPRPDMDALDPDSVRLALTDLTTCASTRTHAERPGSWCRARRTRRPRWCRSRSRRPLSSAPPRESASDAAIAFVAGRWAAGLVMTVREEAGPSGIAATTSSCPRPCGSVSRRRCSARCPRRNRRSRPRAGPRRTGSSRRSRTRRRRQ